MDIPEHLRDTLLLQLANSQNGIAVLDPDDVLLYYNQAFAELFAFGQTPMCGRTHTEVLRWIYQHGLVTDPMQSFSDWLHMAYYEHRAHVFHNFEIALSDGRWLLFSKQVHPTGNMSLVAADITEAKQTALALQAAHQELEYLAMTDELTGVANRRHFFKRIGEEFDLSRNRKTAISLAMLDLDHFKRVNDQFGHPAGDEVLVHFGGMLRDVLRGRDFPGRVGGEEFAILFPETAQADACGALERLRTTVASSPLNQVAAGFNYTFSAGLVALSDQFRTFNEWISAADHVLYQAKAAGRNRIEAC
ncbi:MAG: diguanylate cyclase [Paludibacterium sp.]|uniref:GGDEF domain-containing protein n=1 Tax=Paludibacterium sp. TaxID=1917523 RepID=UPI0025DF32C4|nr:sensor domain-containing diguanylate cyclase [Paludibacterium sp.]MBV8046048.1 diguanylate cyclase [Paludibacterium sp.]